MYAGNLKQSIGLVGVANARELGGYSSKDGRTVRHGVLLRTGRLFSGSEEDIRRLSEEYHVEKVIDFRSDFEMSGSALFAAFSGSSEKSPDPVPEGAEYLNLPVMDIESMLTSEESDKEEMLSDTSKLIDSLVANELLGVGLYIGFLENKMGKQAYSRLFCELLELGEGRALLFHCTQGKDRTGTAAMLILSALDVDEKTIIEDYVLSNTYNADSIAKKRAKLEKTGRMSPESIEKYLIAFESVDSSNMSGAIAFLKEKYGSVKDYIITGLGVSEADMLRLKEKFLE